MEVIKLLPLSRSEILGHKSTFLDDAFTGVQPTIETTLLGDDLVDTVLAGGYPEAITRKSWARKQDWYHEYVSAIVQRDVAQIEQLAIIPRRGEVVGIEIKSPATVSPNDFSGMRKLAEVCGDRFLQGIVLYDHGQIVSFADKVLAVLVSSL